MSDWNKFNQPEWYGRDYFVDHEGKKYRDDSGQIHGWSYENPTGEMQSADYIVRAWRKMFHPRKMLDVGTGRGTVVAYARKNRIEAYGFDFSKWALTDGLYKGCDSEWVKVHDATEPWPYDEEEFDLVTALDFYEHVFIDDLPVVESEMRRVSKRWCFLQIAVVGGDVQKGYVIRKGEEVPIELEANAVAGHVTVQHREWWIKRFKALGFRDRRDMLHTFSQLVYPPMVRNWWRNAIVILEKVE